MRHPRAGVTRPAPIGGMNPTAKQHGPQQWDVFDVSLELIRTLRGPLVRITTVDAALTTQIRRAASSVSLNLSEGRRRSGRDRIHAWRIAAGSAEEVRASLLVADAWGYAEPELLAPSLALLDRISAMLYRMTH